MEKESKQYERQEEGQVQGPHEGQKVRGRQGQEGKQGQRESQGQRVREEEKGGE